MDRVSVAPIEAVVFDLGGVLIEWDPRHLYGQLFDDEESMERFLAEVCTTEWNGRQDEGRPWTEAIASLSAEHPDDAAMIAAFRERWVEMLGGPIPGTEEVLEEVRAAGLRTFALSNWSAETFPIARPLFPFLEWFDGILLSGEVRVAKPDPRIFEILLERFGLEAATTFFVDDSAGNVDAAAKLGIVARQFTDAASLRRQLVDLGVLPMTDGADAADGPDAADIPEAADQPLA